MSSGRGRDSPVRVLHAEDDERLASLTGQFLEREGPLDVTHVADGERALERLDDDDVDFECVVSDYEMPCLDGLALLDAVREEHPELPFVLFTGKGSEEIASDAISKGVTDYLQKGTGTDQYELLANRIENAVESYRTREALEQRVSELHESERRFRTLVSNIPGLVYRCENERGWPMSFVSEGATALTGYASESLESGAVSWGGDVLVDAQRDALWQAVQLAVEDREPFQVEYEIRTRDGESKWVWERGRGVFEGDELVALEGFITDETEERELREELRRERDVTRRLLETSPVGILVNELDGSFRLVNERAAAILGVGRDAILDRTYDDDAWALETPDGDPLPEADHAFTRLKRKAEAADADADVRVADVEHSLVRGDGERLVVSVNGAPLYDDAGDLELLVFTIQVVDE